MWVQELGLVYEDWRNNTLTTKGLDAPNQPKPGLTFKNNKIGTTEPTLAASSQAGDVQFGNPYEQEEVISGTVSKQKVCEIIDKMCNQLNDSNQADRIALLSLSTLKENIKKL